MKYSQISRVSFFDTDLNGVLSPSSVVRKMQEAGFAQFRDCGVSLDELRRKEGKAFFLNKLSVSLYHPLFEDDEIETKTWACSVSRGANFLRAFRIYRGEEVRAEGMFSYALLNLEKRRLCRVEDSPFPFGADDMLDLDLPSRNLIPSDLPLVLRGERTVSYSDCDRNAHMDSAVYPNMLCDHLPDPKKERVLSMQIAFLNEAKIGETFKIYRGEGNGCFFFRTQKEDGKKGIEAMLITEEAGGRDLR